MNKKTKLIALISSFCFVLATCLFSVFAVKVFSFNMGGSIEFVAPGVEATVSAATLNGVTKKSGSGTMSSFTTTRGMSASDIANLDGVKSWSGLQLLFTDDSDGKATIKFTITNNSNKDIENIMVKLSTSTTSSSPIQATPSADFCIIPGGSHEFTISLSVTNPENSALLNNFAITVELKALKTSEIPSTSEQEEKGLSFSTNASTKTASFASYTGSATSVEIPATVKDESGNIYTVTEIPDSETEEQSPFYEVRKTITSIMIPSTLTKIGDYAFTNCSELTGDLVIPNSVKTIGAYAFRDCYGFDGSLIIGDGVETIGEYAFYSCASMTGDLIIPDSVITIGGNAFGSWCSFDGILKIGKNVTTIGEWAFECCCKISTDLIIPNSVQTIGEYAFGSCPELTGLVIGSGVLTIGEQAFVGCRSLESISIDGENPNYYSKNNCLISKKDKVLVQGCNNSVIPQDEGISEIGYGAFYYLNGITGNLIIPDSVTTIGDSAFSGCSNITSITILATTPPTLDGTYCFDGISSTCKIYVPVGSVDTYKTATNWAEYASRIVAISE